MWSDLRNALDDMDGFFGKLESGLAAGAEGLRAATPGRFASRTRSSGGFIPHVDLREEADRYQLSADLPGVSQNDVELSVHGNEVCLTARRQARDPQATWLSTERRAGETTRCWSLPFRIAEDKVQATLADGVLTADLRKAEPQPTEERPPVRIDWRS
eukprot:Hpha_TRINITY_DN4244_c0_g1::TRINITY_DN4244_c0_g1_i1::g.186719::m.186719/K13993/HSP20; HSP20 family protein